MGDLKDTTEKLIKELFGVIILIINLTRYLAAYYGRYNLRANCVSPGGIFDNQDPIFVKNYEKKVPLKRMGNADDIAPAVAFLLSDGAKYITGQNIAVDGGWSVI